ncbi:MAG TPA: formaldehyde-activating enzyme [Gaiellales bacterium]|jgi:5,6,7,8-tetrahydromethanopterin hydro-lyase
MTDLDEYDGRIGEAWAGDVPNGSHINLAIGRRGSATAAAAVSALANPRPGHAPVVVCLGAGNAVRPVTIMTNKAPAIEDLHQRITWGAAQLGIGQGVMDAVADGRLPAEIAGELVLLVAVWVDPEANDETASRIAARVATREAIDDALSGAPEASVRAIAEGRETARNAFYGGS